MVLPECLVFYSDESVYKVFRHVLILDDLTVLSIENIVYLFAFIVINGRGCIYGGINVLVVVLRSDRYYGKRVDQSCHNTDKTDSDQIGKELKETELVFLILYGFAVFYVCSSLRRIVILILLQEKETLDAAFFLFRL